MFFWALVGIGIGALLTWNLRSRDGDSPDQMFVHPAKPEKEVAAVVSCKKRLFLHGIASTHPEMF